MKMKRLLTIQDISCVGQCSLTVALPIISSFGIETSIIPSTVLSTHTGGFGRPYIRDLSDDILKIFDHFKRCNISFDGLYTGYIGNSKQMEYIEIIRKELLKDNAPFIVDPAMADNGKLYSGFDDLFVEKMRKFICGCDILLPNITEAALLTCNAYKEIYDEDYIKILVEGLIKFGAKKIILTGVSFENNKIGVCVFDGTNLEYYFDEKLPRNSHGTGDIFASVFVAKYLNGKSLLDAATIAAKFVKESMKNTPSDHTYGVYFEKVLSSGMFLK